MFIKVPKTQYIPEFTSDLRFYIKKKLCQIIIITKLKNLTRLLAYKLDYCKKKNRNSRRV